MKKMFMLMLVVVAVLVILVGCESTGPEKHVVGYSIRGTVDSVLVIIAIADGDSLQFDNVVSGWDYELDEKLEAGTLVHITAISLCETGSVFVYITKDDKVIERASGTGAYVTVEASASL